MYRKDVVYTLLKKTLTLLEKDERTTIQLHGQTGLPFYWLKKLRAGEFTNPSVNRVQHLYEFLMDETLSV